MGIELDSKCLMTWQNVNAADLLELTEIITLAELVATENWDGAMVTETRYTCHGMIFESFKQPLMDCIIILKHQWMVVRIIGAS